MSWFMSRERFTIEVDVYLIQPCGRKTGRSSFFPFPVTEACDSCNSFGLANREVSVLNQLYSEGMACLCFSTRCNPNPGPFYFKRNTHTEQTFSRSDIHVLYLPLQEQFFFLGKRHRIHSCFTTVNLIKMFQEDVMQPVFMK